MPYLKFAIRLLIAAVFLAGSIGKLSAPLENFEEVLRTYEIFPEFSIIFLARLVPIAELGIGVLLAVGLLTRFVLFGALCFFGAFIRDQDDIIWGSE